MGRVRRGPALRRDRGEDTVPLLPNQDIVIRTRFTDFPGKFVFHCHIINHEDNVMMAVVEVVR